MIEDMKVRMVPHIDDLKSGESGIHEIVRKWFAHLPNYGIDLVSKNADSFDILAVHAGMSNRYPDNVCIVSHLHGLYWSSDYPALHWEWAANETVINSMRRADGITVPSSWVAESVQRDMRINPTVIPHGVDYDEWQHDYTNDGYILAYAKNRVMDVCNPAFITEIARRFPDKLFLCTFAPKDAPGNVRIMGLLPHEKMKQVIQRAAVTISPIKETFGLLTLESMAAGTPVLGYDYGGNKDLIKHGMSGYLARPGDIDDLSEGLNYCLKYRDTLSINGKTISKLYTWDAALKKLADFYHATLIPHGNKVSVIIPTYNYAERVNLAIESALNQTLLPAEIIIVDDGSTDNTRDTISSIISNNHLVPIRYIYQNNAGVATARNNGIDHAIGDYILCLDADDRIAPEFLRACVEGLDKDPTLGIAYTGLLAVESNGKEIVSSWPPEYNFDNMVYPGGINQVPTCALFRRRMWERIGGYRSRYCPQGAGSEDAEFWLRAGLYGFGGKRVTDAPLFLYSYKSGRVSGNKEYHEIDWRGLHPSTKDKQHPFGSVAKPADGKLSHPVRQYDEPVISVIIPVGPGHKQHVFNALDSLESQTLRKWEAIIVDDAPAETEWVYDGVTDMIKAYPYARIIQTIGGKGAGYARNRGVEQARASLITFLDADDNLLVPEALEKMLAAWNETGMAVYSDYMSKAVITPEEANRLKGNNRLVSFDPKSGLAMHRSNAADYDCEHAIIQPANPLFIWNLITTLIPKIWHDEIGGFDETMPSWEDWEYWLRLARAGKCFVRIPEPLIAYRFYTGGRRETGIQMPQELLSYISHKFEGGIMTPCRTCGGGRKTIAPATKQLQTSPISRNENQLNDNDVVLITYENPNRGQHKVVGAYTKTNYGYRAGGGVEHFYVHKGDIESHPDWFVPYTPPVVVVDEPKPTAPPPPSVITTQLPDFIETKAASEDIPVPKDNFKPLDLQSIPGITEKIAEGLHAKGVREWQDIVDLGIDGLKSVEGIGEKRAEAILTIAQKKNVV